MYNKLLAIVKKVKVLTILHIGVIKAMDVVIVVLLWYN